MINLLLNEDQAMIAEAAREYLAGELPLERLRPKAAAVDAAAVREGMGRLGWFAVGLPEAAGGSAMGLVEEMLIQRELGRYVASPATLALVIAGHVCAAAGDEAQARELTGGERSLGLAVIPPEASGKVAAYVLDWRGNEPIVGWTDHGVGLFPAEAFTEAANEPCTDDSVTLHAGKLDLDRALHWVTPGQAPLLARAQVLLAAALCGLADHACELTVDYAKMREQFGKPIGSFQAVKHRCADMGVRARLAWYQTSVAALKLAGGAEDAPLQVASALLVAAEAAHENGRASVQLHGGIGFQAEADVHWFVKRAHVYDQLAGGRHKLSLQVLEQPALT